MSDTLVGDIFVTTILFFRVQDKDTYSLTIISVHVQRLLHVRYEVFELFKSGLILQLNPSSVGHQHLQYPIRTKSCISIPIAAPQ